MFVLCLRSNMCAYVYPSVRMYLSASCVRVSMRAFVCVQARVREGVCVSPSVRPSVRPSVHLSVCPCSCSCVQMFDRRCVRSTMHAFVCLYARVHEGVCVSPSERPSVCVRPFACLSISLSACMFVRPNV